MKKDRRGITDGWDPFENMPLELMMLVGVRSEALAKYRLLDEGRREELERMAKSARGRIEKEQLIDRIERGDFS